jgi:hypothetical protein
MYFLLFTKPNEDNMMRTISLFVLSVFLLFGNCATQEKKAISPLEDLPPWIERITFFGQRADFSHDGKRLLFLEKTFGDVYEVEIETKKIRPLTHHYFHEGYTRALYLSNGDILLSGARKFNAEDPWPSREKFAELWVLKKDISEPPIPLGELCFEGPAVSRKRMHIAWTLGVAFFEADIIYKQGIPTLINKTKILDENNLPYKCEVETQNFRPPDEKELIFSVYVEYVAEVMGLDIENGNVINYTNTPPQYDEPEGIFPDGKHALVESDKHNLKGPDYIDIYKLALDGSGEMERITHFVDYPGYEATNPVMSDDGRFMAFQVARKGDAAGIGHGILLYDFQNFERLNKK